MKIQTIAVLVDLENPMEWLFTFLFCFFGLLGGSNSLNQVISMNNTKTTTTTTKKTLKEHQTHTDKNRKKKEEIGKFKI